MRQSRWLSLLGLLLLPASSLAQSVRYQSQALSSRGAGIANATIAVCTQPSVTTTQPCSPLATLATSTSTTSGGANPLTADSFGNFFFYAAPGRYTVQIYGPAVFGQVVIPDVEISSVAGGSSGAFSSLTVSGTGTLANLNKVIFVDQQAGATADVKFANACAALPATGGTLDARGFGAGNQSIAALVSCGSATQPVTFIWDEATVFQPSTSSNNMFQPDPFNTWLGVLHIDTTNQSTYSGNPVLFSQLTIPTSHVAIQGLRIDMASGSTGPCILFSSASGSAGIFFNDIYSVRCTAGTAANGITFQNSAGGFINGNKIFAAKIYNSKHAILANQAGTGAIAANEIHLDFEANSLATALDGFNATAAGANFINGNEIHINCYDQTAGNSCVNVTSLTGVTQNWFIGEMFKATDSSTFIANHYLFLDSTANLNGLSPAFPWNISDIRVRDQAIFNTAIVGAGSAITSSGAGGTMTATIGTGNVTTAGTAVNTLTCQAQTNITVTGAATTDNVQANIGAVLPATWQTGIVLSAHVTATNTVTVYLCNPTATATITPAATQVNVRVVR